MEATDQLQLKVMSDCCICNEATSESQAEEEWQPPTSLGAHEQKKIKTNQTWEQFGCIWVEEKIKTKNTWDQFQGIWAE